MKQASDSFVGMVKVTASPIMGLAFPSVTVAVMTLVWTAATVVDDAARVEIRAPIMPPVLVMVIVAVAPVPVVARTLSVAELFPAVKTAMAWPLPAVRSFTTVSPPPLPGVNRVKVTLSPMTGAKVPSLRTFLTLTNRVKVPPWLNGHGGDDHIRCHIIELNDPCPRGSAESPHPESEPRNTVISTSMTMTGRRFAFLNIPILLSNIRYTGSTSFPHTFEFPCQTLGLGDLRRGHPDGLKPAGPGRRLDDPCADRRGHVWHGNSKVWENEVDPVYRMFERRMGMLRKAKRLPVIVMLVLITVFLGSSGCGDSADPLGTGIIQFYDVTTDVVITSMTIQPGSTLTVFCQVRDPP